MSGLEFVVYAVIDCRGHGADSRNLVIGSELDSTDVLIAKALLSEIQNLYCEISGRDRVASEITFGRKIAMDIRDSDRAKFRAWYQEIPKETIGYWLVECDHTDYLRSEDPGFSLPTIPFQWRKLGLDDVIAENDTVRKVIQSSFPARYLIDR